MVMPWLRFLSGSPQHRWRRAYFRRPQTSDLEAPLRSVVDHIVTVRFIGIGRADSPFAGERLYRGGTGASKFIRPERDFDFLD